jgi:hypothetical protein
MVKRMVICMMDGWSGWFCPCWMVEEDGYVHDGWLKRMVMSMMDG